MGVPPHFSFVLAAVFSSFKSCVQRNSLLEFFSLDVSLVPRNVLIDRLENYYLFAPRLVDDMEEKKGKNVRSHVTVLTEFYDP